MTGILLIITALVWAWISAAIVFFIIRKIHKKIGKYFLGCIFFVIIFVSPLCDEIIGGHQFRGLCDDARLLVDEDKAEGRKVKSRGAINTYLEGYAVKIRRQYWSYEDIESGELLVSWNEYYAKGGWLIRTFNISENSSPLTFKGECRPVGSRSPIFKKLSITKMDV